MTTDGLVDMITFLGCDISFFFFDGSPFLIPKTSSHVKANVGCCTRNWRWKVMIKSCSRVTTYIFYDFIKRNASVASEINHILVELLCPPRWCCFYTPCIYFCNVFCACWARCDVILPKENHIYGGRSVSCQVISAKFISNLVAMASF